MNVIRKHLASPAMIVACAALIVALGGVSYAAAVLPKNSVGTAQLQKKAITGSKLRKNAVTGATVKNGSLLAADFKAGQLPAGAQGPKGDEGDPGPPGPRGEPGPAGAAGYEVRLASSSQDSSTGKQVTAQCPTGKVAIGGGASLFGAGNVVSPPLQAALNSSTITNLGDGWIAKAHEVAPTDTGWTLVVRVICANAA